MLVNKIVILADDDHSAAMLSIRHLRLSDGTKQKQLYVQNHH
ncbi:MAG: hypothetical protein RHS_5899 [Robinsoniella sp. RHS]|nr:MAG: hypothetical protein RHS_5899 [Robinsoniella sp. RHS]